MQTSNFWTVTAFLGMTAVGTFVVPALTKKAADKATKKKITSHVSKIDLDNMGPEIVQKNPSQKNPSKDQKNEKD